MNTCGIKHIGKRAGFIAILLAALLFLFLPGKKVYAANVEDTITAGKAAADGDAAAGNAREGSNINGTLGPLQFTLNTEEDGEGLSATLQILLVLTVIALAPSLLIMVTCFTRIIIVLHFVRSAIGTQTTPPNQVLVGLALFLTFFIMSPVFTQINTNAIQPLSQGEISQEEAFEAGAAPIRTFMLKYADEKDIRLFMDIAGIEKVNKVEEIPLTVIIPSFIISELRKAFIIGFLIYLPFIVIDMVVSSTLMSMGMMMLPPTMISMPFKILLFIMADGWGLIVGELVKSFY